MIHIKYKLDKSDRHGIGFFADQDVQQGMLVYTASPLLDLNISQETFEKLSKSEQEEVKYWGFWDETNRVWHVDFDMTKFINHSPDANLSQDKSKSDAYLVTTRDIIAGEELTQNYLDFESEEDLKGRGIEIDSLFFIEQVYKG